MEKKMAGTTGSLIIITGPESTGKTTVAEALSRKFNGRLYPEYAREYIQKLDHKYTYSDIEQIANFQYLQFKEFKKNEQLSFFDTYLIITKIWFIWHANKYPLWIDNAIKETSGALYLICAPDIEWVHDSVRENGGTARLELFNLYKQELIKHNIAFKVITGQGELRLTNAERFVELYLNNDETK
jgi:NadR type nicotinamide-nucleotide adenylyltransferase